MGKNNRDKREQYQHEDLNAKFLGKRPSNNSNYQPKQQKTYEKTEDKSTIHVKPEISVSARGTLELFDQQLESFMDVQNHLHQYDSKEIRLSQKNLFSFETWPMTWNDTSDKVYILNRMVKMDRESQELIRATVNCVIINNGVPTYAVECYVTKQYTGSAVVIKMDENGPNRKSSAIFNIVDGRIQLD